MPKREVQPAPGAPPVPRGPTFYDRVYELVRQVPPGKVTTYGNVALYLGSPMAARAVGYALNALQPGNNVPWWRVINAQGAIVLKRRGANADLQRALLEREGITFDANDRTDLARYRWWPTNEMRPDDELPGDH